MRQALVDVAQDLVELRELVPRELPEVNDVLAEKKKKNLVALELDVVLKPWEIWANGKQQVNN